MSLELAWREKSDDELAAAARHLPDYTEDAQRVITAELGRRGIALDGVEGGAPLDGADQTSDLPTAWLRFWTWIRLPGGAVLTLVALGQALTSPKSVMDPQHPIATFVSTALGLVAASAALIVAVGLHKRLLWAWKANFGLICAEVVLVPFGLDVTAKSGISGATAYLFGVALFAVAWLWPNALYFRKRRHLFKPATARPTSG